MDLTPKAEEMITYLLCYTNDLTEWEKNFVTSIDYWVKVRKTQPNHAQLMLMNMIYTRIKKDH